MSLATSFLMMATAFAATAAADDPPLSPTLDRFAAEAARMKAETPDRWALCRNQSDRVFAANATLVANWRNRNSPPAPNLKPLVLPLAFLVDAARHAAEVADVKKTAVRVGMPGGPEPAIWMANAADLNVYLDAIAHHPDDQRIVVLLEFRDEIERRVPGAGRYFRWSKRLAEAATRDWAAEQIRSLAPKPPKLVQYDPEASLFFCLVNRFAGNLAPDVATLAYVSLRDQYPLGPGSGEDERIWDILLRLDPTRARKEILPYFYGPTGRGFRYNIFVPIQLQKHAGPSPELAKEVRVWLQRTDLDPGHRRMLRVILVRADPEKEVKPAIEQIDRLLADPNRKAEPVAAPDDVSYLLSALDTVGTKEADDALVRFVFERKISDSDRIQSLDSLARRHDPRTQDLVARWLTEEAPHMQAYLRKIANERWGEDGRLILHRIDAPR